MKKNILLLLLFLLLSLVSCNAAGPTYEVTWDVDGNTFIEKYSQGEIPLFKFSTEKDNDEEYSYEFIGWDKEIVAVVENTTYTAQYEKTEIMRDVYYTVTWKIDDKELEETYKEGELPTFKYSTEKEADEVYSYNFIGWDKEVVNVSGDVTYTAMYEKAAAIPAAKYYTVTWTVGEATYSELYVEGEMPEFKFSTAIDSTNEYKYVFVGWDKTLEEVSQDVNYVAEFNEVAIKYVYTWVVNEVATTEEYSYGEIPSYKGDTPTKPSDSAYSYEFIGWSEELTEVVEDKTLIAQFELNYNSYDITFVVDGNEVVEEFYYGAVPYPTVTPTKDYDDNYVYKFTGWVDDNGNSYENQLPKVVKNSKYTAVFSKVERWNGVKINALNLDGSLIKSEVVTATVGEKYTVNAPGIDGYVPSHDYVSGLTKVNEEVNIYYSKLSVWDGTTISGSLSGSGTEADPYLIQSAADLAYVKQNYNFSGKYLKMTVSVDVNNTNFMIKWFSGHFDGNNCSVRNLKIETTAAITGFFNQISGGNSIKNLIVYGSVKSTATGDSKLAGVVGYLGGSISNCTNYASITGNTDTTKYDGNVAGVVGEVTKNCPVFTDCVNYGNIYGRGWNYGGVVGLSSTVVKNCKNFGDVHTMTDCVGGVVGASRSSIVLCENYGSVTADISMAGGIVNEAQSMVADCINYGTVYAKYSAGGVVAQSKGMIENCINNGVVTAGATGAAGIVAETIYNIRGCINNGKIVGGNYGTGGIVGYLRSGKVSDSINNGEIAAKADAGGIAGDNQGVIDNCTNNGVVTGTTCIGGIAGLSYGKITNSTNNGAVTSSSWGAGGIAGRTINVDSDVVSCVNKGAITAKGQIGGIVGRATGMITKCTNSGVITGQTDIIGGICGDLTGSTHVDVINTTNTQNGTVSGPNSQNIIGKIV